MKSHKSFPLVRLTAVLLSSTFAAQAQILIDFGEPTNTTGGNWNNVYKVSSTPNPSTFEINGTDSTVATSLIDNTGAASGIMLTMTNAFQADNGLGVTTGGGSLGNLDVTSVTRDSLYGSDNYTGGDAGLDADNLGVLQFSSLNPAESYIFKIFASRQGALGTGNNRETQYDFVGATAETHLLQPVDNANNFITTSQLAPDGSGNLTLTISKGPNNDQENGFFYINAMEITAIPEPSNFASIAGFLGMTLFGYRRRQGS